MSAKPSNLPRLSRLSRWLRSAWPADGAGPANAGVPTRQRFQFESLEPRVLMSADPLAAFNPAPLAEQMVVAATASGEQTVIDFGHSAVRLAADAGGDISYVLPIGDNDVTLSFNDATGQLALTGQGFEALHFDVPVGGSLTLYMGAGDDHLQVGNLRGLGGFDLVLDDPDNLLIDTDVLLDGGFTVRTLGNIRVADQRVVDVGGDIVFEAQAGLDRNFTLALPIATYLEATASITLGAGSVLRGANVALTSTATAQGPIEIKIDEIALAAMDVQALINTLVPSLGDDISIDFRAAAGSQAAMLVRDDNQHWEDEGFRASQWIQVMGSEKNDGYFRIAALDGTRMLLAAGSGLQDESGVDSPLVQAVHHMASGTVLDFVQGGTAGTPSETNTITRATGNWLDEGFKRYQNLVVEGAGDNDGEYLILALDATTITLQKADSLVTQRGVAVATLTARGDPAGLPVAVVDAKVHTGGKVALSFAATAGGGSITRADAGGNWLAEGFAVGQTLTVEGSAHNNGIYRITGISAQTLLLASDTQALRAEQTRNASVTAAGLQVPAAGQSFSLSGNTITRTSGSWAAAGFAVGQRIAIDGATVGEGINNGHYLVAAISGATLTLQAPGFAGFATESSADISVAFATVLNQPVLSFDAAAGTITRSSGNWTLDGFVVQGRISIEGTVANDGMYVVGAISADGRTLSVKFAANTDSGLQNEVAGQARVQGILSNAQLNPAYPERIPTAGELVDYLAGALPIDSVLDAISFAKGWFNYLATAVRAEATSRIDIGTNAQLLATGNLTLLSQASASAVTSTAGLIVGVTYASANADARTTLQSGASVVAGGTVTIASEVQNTLDASTDQSTDATAKAKKGSSTSGLKLSKALKVAAPSLGITYGEASSVSRTLVLEGARVQGAMVDIHATNQNDFSVASSATVTNKPGKPNAPKFSAAAGVAVSNVASEALVRVDGSVTTTGDLSITALSDNQNNDTSTLTAIGPGMKTKGGMAKKLNAVLGAVTDTLAKAAQPGIFGMSASLALAWSENRATAEVGGQAVLQSGRALTVSSRAIDNFQAWAVSSSAPPTKLNIAGAVAATHYANRADAVVVGGARLDAAGLLSVDAQAEIPLQLQFRSLLDDIRAAIAPLQGEAFEDAWAGLTEALGDMGAVLSNLRNVDGLVDGSYDPARQVDQAVQAVGDGSTALSGLGEAAIAELQARLAPVMSLLSLLGSTNVLLPTQLGTTYTQATAGTSPKKGKSANASVSGSVNIMVVENGANASIGEGARINQNTTSSASDGQVVEVRANARMESINLAGVAKPTAITRGSTASLGGTFLNVAYEGDAQAWIADGAEVHAEGGVVLDAAQNDLFVGVAQAGGSAEKAGIAGAVTNYVASHTTRAWIEDTATVHSGGNLQVRARSEALLIEVGGTLQQAGVAAVGASLALTNLDNTTEAFIGNRLAPSAGAPSVVGNITARGDIVVLAHQDELLVTVAVAGALDSGSSAAAMGPATSGGAGPAPVKNGGVGISGASAINVVRDNVRAWIAGATVSTNDGDAATADTGMVTVSATSNSLGVSTTGAFSVGLSGKGGVQLSGGYGMNAVERDVLAWITADVDAHDVMVQATSDEQLYAVTADGSVTANWGGNGVDAAGSVAVNLSDTRALAWIGDGARIAAARDAVVSSRADNITVSLTGALAVGGSVGVGGAVDFGLVTMDVQAWIGAAQVQAGRDLAVRATAGTHRITVSASLAASEKVGFAGVLGTHTLDRTVVARVGSGADVVVGGNADIAATDAVMVIAVAGGGGYGGKAGFGIAANNVNVLRALRAGVDDNAQMDVAGRAIAGQTQGQMQDQAPGLRVRADAEDQLVLAAVAGEGSETFALAASATVTTLRSDVDAAIGDGARINQRNQAGTHAGQSVVVEAHHGLQMLGASGGLSVAGTVGIGASTDVQVLTRNVTARIGAGALVNARDDIVVQARHALDLVSATVTGTVAYGGSGVAVDGSVGVLTLTSDVGATVGAGAVLAAGDDVVVAADSEHNIVLVDGGISGGGQVGFGGALAVLAHVNTSRASIGDGAHVAAAGDVVVSANHDGNTLGVSGALAVGGNAAGVGLSATTLTLVEDITARIGDNAVIVALGQGTAHAVQTGQAGRRTTDTDFHGVSVSATSTQDLLAVTAVGAGGNVVGLAGAASMVVLTQRTHATVGNGTTITAADNGVPGDGGAGQGINIFGSDHTRAMALSGAIGAAATAGAGGGASGVVLVKDTLAQLDGDSHAQGHVRVQALSAEQVVTVGAGIGAAGTAGIAGGAAVSTLFIATHARISDNASVDADGNVVLAADDMLHANNGGGAVTGAGTVALGGGMAVAMLAQDTTAVIGAHAQVDAGGRAGTLEVLAGAFEDGSEATEGAQLSDYFEVLAPLDRVGNAVVTAQPVRHQRLVDFTGLSVTATDRATIGNIGVAAGAAGSGVVQAAGTVAIVAGGTRAGIGDGSRINQRGNGAANVQQDVRVAAASDLHYLGVAGAFGADGVFTYTPSADSIVVTTSTEAIVGDGVVIDSRRDTSVRASAHQHLMQFVAGGAISGTAAEAFTAGNVVLGAQALARIGADADIHAGGNIVVCALHGTGVTTLTGAGAIGIDGGGIGASQSVVSLTKRSDATVGVNAALQADANAADEAGVLDGMQAANSGAIGNGAQRGVIVQASSSENLLAVSASLGAGGLLGMAGSVVITLIDSDTTAAIAGGARINTATSGENELQNVVVAAANEVDIHNDVGVLAGGLVAGLGGAADVGIVRNDTHAFLGDSDAAQRGSVQARNDVAVHALARKDIRSKVLSGAAGSLGLSSAVSVYSLGGNFRDDYAFDDAGTPRSGNALQGKGGDADTLTATSMANGQGLLDYGGVYGFTAADAADGSITLAGNNGGPGWHTGDALVYRSGTAGNQPIGGLRDGDTVYAIVDDPSHLRLAASRADALGGNALALTGGTGSGHTLATASADATQRSTGKASTTITAHTPGALVTSATRATANLSAGTQALVGAHNDLHAGRHILVGAQEQLAFELTDGGVLATGIGVGFSVGILVNNAALRASIGDGGVLSAVQDIVVASGYTSHTQALAFSGANAGLGAFVGAIVVVVDDASSQATLGAVHVQKAGEVRVEARLDTTVRVSTVAAGSAGSGIGAGTTVVALDLRGAAHALVNGAANIGAGGPGSGDAVGALNVHSAVIVEVGSHPDVEVMAAAASLALLGTFSGSVVVVHIDTRSVAEVLGDAAVTVSGDVALAAETQQKLDVKVAGASLGGIAGLGAVVAQAYLGGATLARIGGDGSNKAHVRARRLSVTADGGDVDATVFAVGASGGLIVAGTGASATLKVNPEVEATIGRGTAVQAGGDVLVEARSGVKTIDARSIGAAAGGGVAVALSLADARWTPTVRASIDNGAGVAGSSVGIHAFTAQQNVVHASASPFSGAGLTAASYARAAADASGTVDATVGAGATVSATGALSIQADGNNAARAEGLGVAVGVVGVGLVQANATSLGVTRALVEDTTESEAGASLNGATVTVGALARDNADARTTAAAGGVIAGTGSQANAATNSTVQAHIGTGAQVVAGNVDVLARYLPDADATANGNGGGVVQAGVSLAKGNVTATVGAGIGAGSNITATGHVRVQALRADMGAAPVDQVLAVDGSADTLTYGDFGIQAGDVLRYSTTTPAIVTGLTPGRDYLVLSAAPGPTAGQQVLKLGLQFAGAQQTVTSGALATTFGLDAATDTIRFAGPHLLQTGDALVYDGGDSAVPGLVQGRKYFVRVIDDATIKLFTTAAAAGAASTPNLNPNSNQVDVANDRIVVSGANRFTNGQAVTYRAAVDLAFGPDTVDLMLGADNLPATDTDGNLLHEDNNGIYFASGHSFVTGEAVQYRTNGTPMALAGGGTLVDGGTYYVIKLSDQRLQLASAPGGTALLLVAGNDRFTRHSLSDQPIAGLESGRTYYVVGVTGTSSTTSFQLAALPGGTAIDLGWTAPPAAAAARMQFIGSEGIDLGAATGTHRLRIDIADNVMALGLSAQLLGAGAQPLAQVAARAGDGNSTATANASSGGLVTVDVNRADVALTQTVQALALGTIVAGGNVVVRSDADSTASTNVTNASGGYVAVKAGKTDLQVTSGSTARLGGNVTAGGDVHVDAVNMSTQRAYARAVGGGVIDIAVGEAAATFAPTTLAELADGLVLRAGGALALDATLSADQRATARVAAKGLGSNATGLSAATLNAIATRASVGSGADLQADTVALNARGSNIRVLGTTETDAGGLGVHNDARANASLTQLNEVLVAGNARLKGIRGVDLRAGFDSNVLVKSDADGDTDAAGGRTIVRSNATAHTDATITTASGATVLAGPRAPGGGLQAPAAGTGNLALYAQAYGTGLTPEAALHRGKAVADVGSGDADTVVTGAGAILWGADVVLNAGQSPVIEIDAHGVVHGLPPGVTATTSGDTIRLSDIMNPGGAQLVFDAGTDAGNSKDPVADRITLPTGAARPTFTIEDNFSAIHITNRSDKSLRLGNIAPVGSGTARADLIAPSVGLLFDIVRGTGATDITISNLSTTADTDIILGGTITNPLGRTTLTALRGDIVALADRGQSVDGRTSLIQARELVLSAERGSIGYDKDATDHDHDGQAPVGGHNRLNVDLVQTGEGAASRFDAAAGGDLRLDLLGRLRVAGASPDRHSFTIDGVLHAGLRGQGRADILLQGAVHEQPATGAAAGKLLVSTPNDPANAADSADNGYATQFRPDGNAAPANGSAYYGSSASAIASVYTFGGAGGTAAALLSSGTGGIRIVAADAAAAEANRRIGIRARTDVAGTGAILVDTSGDITLTETQGELRVDAVWSRMGDIELTAAAGDIHDTQPATSDAGNTAWVTGNHIRLTAAAGEIGALGDLLEIDSAAQASGTLTAAARDGAYLRETAGDLTLGSVLSRTSDVVLVTLSGAVLESTTEAFTAFDAFGNIVRTGDDTAEIQGRNIEIFTTGGGVGTATNSIEIFGAGHGQKQQNGLKLDNAVPAAGHLVVNTTGGGIFLTSVDAWLDVLEATTAGSEAGIRLSTLDTVQEDEGIRVRSAGRTVWNDRLVAHGNVQSAGLVELRAGDDILLGTNTLVRSDKAVWLRGDMGLTPDELTATADTATPGSSDAGDAGSTIDVQGQVQAPQLLIVGGNNLDYLQLNNASGINAGGSTRVVGNGGDDRLYARATTGDTVLDGGAGADRFYLSGNASKALFMVGSAYDDGVGDQALDSLTGTLANLGGIRILTGADGAQGTDDGILVSADAAIGSLAGEITTSQRAGTQAGQVITSGRITGLGMAQGQGIEFESGGSTALLIELGAFNDNFRIQALASTVYASVLGGAGNDTMDVYDDTHGVTGIAGIVSFQGQDGFDTLQVRGDATTDATVAQVSAIGITGLGMGSNTLVAVHNTNFGAGYDLGDGAWPGAIYYASRNVADDSIHSTVEAVELQLGAGDDKVVVDSSTTGITHVLGGAGNDTLAVSSTGSGLHPDNAGRVDHVLGRLVLDGQQGNDTIVLDDTGSFASKTGTLQGHTASGLGMPGQVEFIAPENLQILLGQGADQLFVAAIDAGLTVQLDTGTGQDTVTVGRTAGHSRGGTLAGIQGLLRLNGNGPEAEDLLVLDDSATRTGQSWRITNAPAAMDTVVDGTALNFDITTVERSGLAAGAIQYQRMETVVLDAGAGNDTIDLQGTQRETAGDGKNATFAVNGGAGDDTITIGTPVAGGGYSLAHFLIDLPSTAQDQRHGGIPVMVNGQDGYDTLRFLDTSSTAATNLLFVNRQFQDIFPATLPATGADARWLAAYQAILGADPEATSYGSVVLQKAGSNDPLNVNGRTVEHLAVSLGSGDDVVQFDAGDVYGYDVTVDAGSGNDTFNVRPGVDNRGHTATLYGETGDDLLFVDFAQGVPDAQAFFSFHGGDNSESSENTQNNANGTHGDTLRVAGDGVASGTYTPSATLARSGVVNVAGNAFSFTGVEPLVVHGLARFDILNPADAVADLDVDAIAVADLDLSSLVLHSVSVDGVVAWNAATDVNLDSVPDLRHTGQAVALSADGLTMAVGAELEGSAWGEVRLYAWSGSAWTEAAKLQAPDRASGFGQGFGDALALSADGTRLVVGAPHSANSNSATGAAYVYQRDASGWSLLAGGRLTSPNPASDRSFGRAVAVDGNTVVIGIGGAGERGAAYILQRNATGTGWDLQKDVIGDGVGMSVSVSGNRVAIGVGLADVNGLANAGEVHIYSRGIGGNGSSWTLEARLLASDMQAHEQFGSAVVLQGDRLVVGAPLWDSADGQTDQGRAFVFDRPANGVWTRVARLTAEAGMPEADAMGDGIAGDRFGAAVALAGNYVAVGVPGHDTANVLDAGAAYVFMQLPDLGSGNGASWVRASGASSEGRLGAATPAGASTGIVAQYATADGFGTSLALAANRLVVGMPGYNEVGTGNVLLRPDVGAVRTFATDGLIPTVTSDSVRAETLTDPNGNAATSRYASVTHYDSTTRTLFVGDSAAGKVYLYANEGLYWRPLQTLGDSGAGFGADIDVDESTGRMIVGAPGSAQALVYAYNAGTGLWGIEARLSGQAGSQFGYAVAIAGNLAVVGMPSATATYAGTGIFDGAQADPAYRLDLGTAGGAVVYARQADASWSVAQVLAPTDAALPGVTSTLVADTGLNAHSAAIARPGAGTLTLGFGAWSGHTSNTSGASALPTAASMGNASGSIALGMNMMLVWVDFTGSDTGHGIVYTTGPANTFTANDAITRGLRSLRETQGMFVVGSTVGANDIYAILDNRTSTDVRLTFQNAAQNGPHVITGGNNFQFLHGVTLAPHTFAVLYDDQDEGNGRFATYIENTTDEERTFVGANITGHEWYGVYIGSTLRPEVVDRKTFTGLDNARWGSAVEIVETAGNVEVFVGATGKSRVTFYDLAADAPSTLFHWDYAMGGFAASDSNGLLRRPTATFNGSGGLGAELVSDGLRTYVGTTFSAQGFAALTGMLDTGGSGAPNWQVAGQQVQGGLGLGSNEALDLAGNRLLAGAPSDAGGAGVATVFSSTSAANLVRLHPFQLSGNAMVDVSDVNLHFGVGAQIVSEGFYVVGTDNATMLANQLYVFRQRGAAWSVAAPDLVPSAPLTAKAGVAVAMDGHTAVVGARDHADARGIVHLYTANGSGGWDAAGTLQAPDAAPGSQFGAAVALSGNSLVVGAPGANNGAGVVYFYQRDGDGWRLASSFQGAAGARQGSAVDVFGTWAVSLAAGRDRLNLYAFDGTAWSNVQQIDDAVGVVTDVATVALHQSVLVAGAPSANGNGGAAAIYELNASGRWTVSRVVSAGDLGVPLAEAGRIGAAVDVQDGLVVLGAPGAPGATASGKVYVMSRGADGSWSNWGSIRPGALATLTPATGQAGDHFGASVSLDEGRLLVGAWGRDLGTAADGTAKVDNGAAYAFRLKDGQWLLETPIDPIFANETQSGDMFGYAVAQSGGRVVVGAPQLSGRAAGLISTDGGIYFFGRTVSAPVTLTHLETIEELKEGAQANTVRGTVGGVETSSLSFFDIAKVSLQTGNHDDTVTVGSGGLVAYGLQDFTVALGAGNDTLNVLSTTLRPPVAGSFVAVDAQGHALPPGSTLPPGATFVEAQGRFFYDGGSGTNSLHARADTDWTLDIGLLTASPPRGQMEMANVRDVSLTGGASVNRIKVLRWDGSVVLGRRCRIRLLRGHGRSPGRGDGEGCQRRPGPSDRHRHAGQ
jgi:hypothetical protein